MVKWSKVRSEGKDTFFLDTRLPHERISSSSMMINDPEVFFIMPVSSVACPLSLLPHGSSSNWNKNAYYYYAVQRTHTAAPIVADKRDSGSQMGREAIL